MVDLTPKNIQRTFFYAFFLNFLPVHCRSFFLFSPHSLFLFLIEEEKEEKEKEKKKKEKKEKGKGREKKKMGIHDLSKLLAAEAPKATKERVMDNMFGRKVAIDASNFLYSFLVSIRSDRFYFILFHFIFILFYFLDK